MTTATTTTRMAAPTNLLRVGDSFIPPLTAQSTTAAMVRTKRLPLDATHATLSGADLNNLPAAFSWHQPADVKQYAPSWTRAELPIMLPGSQFGCGCCWAWSVATALSDRFALAANIPNPQLSPSVILACMTGASAQHSEQCGGGRPYEAAAFLQHDVGLQPWTCWDYSWCAHDNQCVSGWASTEQLNRQIPPCAAGQCVSDCAPGQHPCRVRNLGKTSPAYHVLPNSIEALVEPRMIQVELFLRGPVVAVFRVFADFAVGAATDGWAATGHVYLHLPDHDVYQYSAGDMSTACLGAAVGPSGEASAAGAAANAYRCWLGNHAVVIVGWGVERNVPAARLRRPPHTGTGSDANATVDIPYWVVRNSWGPQWNGDGFCHIAMSEPLQGWNTLLGLDRTLVVDGQLNYGVTTFLPDLGRWLASQNMTPDQLLPAAVQLPLEVYSALATPPRPTHRPVTRRMQWMVGLVWLVLGVWCLWLVWSCSRLHSGARAC